MRGQIIAGDSPWFLSALAALHYVLRALGVPPEQHLAAVLTAFLMVALSIAASRLWRSGIRRVLVAVESEPLSSSLSRSSSLSQDSVPPPTAPREVRIFMDGAFDMMHFGHMNAFRLGRSLGTKLIVGINSDESIIKCKGPPLMNDAQRLTMVQSCKFVDQVVPNCPYIMNKEYLDYIIDEFKIDYVIHGDDPCIVDGKDVYATAKAAGKYQSIPRTEGVSTTDLVGRILRLDNGHHLKSNGSSSNGSSSSQHDSAPPAILGQMSRFLTSSQLLGKFSAGNEDPTPGKKVVYVDGAFDTFHCGHIAMLQAAKKRGDYLLVGVHGDAVANRIMGQNLPLLNLHERVLSVLGCRFVDNVLLDAPYQVTPAMVDTLKISTVVVCNSSEADATTVHDEQYAYPRQAGILQEVENPSTFRLDSIFERVYENEVAYQAKFKRKMQAENDFLESKYGRNNNDKAS